MRDYTPPAISKEAFRLFIKEIGVSATDGWDMIGFITREYSKFSFSIEQHFNEHYVVYFRKNYLELGTTKEFGWTLFSPTGKVWYRSKSLEQIAAELKIKFEEMHRLKTDQWKQRILNRR